MAFQGQLPLPSSPFSLVPRCSTPAVEPQEPQELDVAPGGFSVAIFRTTWETAKCPGLRLAAQASPEHAPTC